VSAWRAATRAEQALDMVGLLPKRQAFGSDLTLGGRS
jgi:hypothetical protein